MTNKDVTLSTHKQITYAHIFLNENYTQRFDNMIKEVNYVCKIASNLWMLLGFCEQREEPPECSRICNYYV